jgi:type VI secretion system secreted protein Hcp
MADALAAYAKIPGINGDSAQPHHIQWIQILSVNWASANSSVRIVSAGREAVSSANAFQFTKRIDVASARLFAAAAAGTRFATVDVDLTNAARNVSQSGAESVIYLTVIFRGVVITGIRHGTATRGEPPAETVTLNYGSRHVIYR